MLFSQCCAHSTFKSNGKVVNVLAEKAYGGSEDRAPLILNLSPDRGEWSASPPGPTGEEAGTNHTCFHWVNENACHQLWFAPFASLRMSEFIHICTRSSGVKGWRWCHLCFFHKISKIIINDEHIFGFLSEWHYCWPHTDQLRTSPVAHPRQVVHMRRQ